VKKLIFLTSFLVLSIFCAIAFAYILPGDFIIRKNAEQRATDVFREITLEGSVEFKGPGGTIAGEGTLVINEGGGLELKVMSGHKEHDLVVRSGRVISASESMKSVVDALKGREQLVADMFPILVPNSVLNREIREAGITPEIRSLARFKGRVAFALGARSGDRSSSQLWIDKDSFQILRLMLAGKTADERFDFRFIDYQTSPAPGKAPRTLEILYGQNVLFRMDAEKIYLEVLKDKPAKTTPVKKSTKKKKTQ